METFSALLGLCEGNSPVTSGFLWQRPVTRSFDVFFELRLNKRLSKQSRRRWFETASRSLWRHCNAGTHFTKVYELIIQILRRKNAALTSGITSLHLERQSMVMTCAKLWPGLIIGIKFGGNKIFQLLPIKASWNVPLVICISQCVWLSELWCILGTCVLTH